MSPRPTRPSTTRALPRRDARDRRAAENVAVGPDVTPRDVAVTPDVTPPRDVVVDRPAPIVDSDGDGYRSDVDCNDRNVRIHPGAVDLCSDGVDQDCNGRDAVCACAKRIHVLVDDYGTVDGPGLEGRSNGCWEVHSVNDRVPMEFRHCFNGANSLYACGGHIRQIDGANWYYDDTNTSHGGSDATIIRQCATRCGASATPQGTGFVTMAASNGWRYESAGISPVVFIAQLYSSAANEALQSGYFSNWASARRAAPQVSFTHASAAQMSAWTTQVCARLNNGNWMAFYVGSARNAASGGLGPLQADDYLAWSRALNACTR
ncbi:MAG: putative metal-binding motif-containing protein [Polyangiales bacterium]